MLRTVLVGGPAHGATLKVGDDDYHVMMAGRTFDDPPFRYYRNTFWPGVPYLPVDLFIYAAGDFPSRERTLDALYYLWQ